MQHVASAPCFLNDAVQVECQVLAGTGVEISIGKENVDDSSTVCWDQLFQFSGETEVMGMPDTPIGADDMVVKDIFGEAVTPLSDTLALTCKV